MSDSQLASDAVEHRIAAVFYGGVSLCVYMGGVALELLSIVRATAIAADAPDQYAIPDEELSRVEGIYRRVARGDGSRKPQRVRVDVISGTSAGGINGIFLAAAIANDGDLSILGELWAREGSIDTLLNDHPEERNGTMDALLRGDHMYRQLFGALQEVTRVREGGRRFDSGRLDLYVTATDVRGHLVMLPVSGQKEWEKRHRQRFHFAYDRARNDFEPHDTAILAFAARATSSFPVAFRPFCWADVELLEPADAKVAEHWVRRLGHRDPAYAARPLTDGGYVQNKPFSWAVAELARRQSSGPVTRTLLYVEPDPETIDPVLHSEDQQRRPTALENAREALTIRQYEPIAGDLEAVLERNLRVAQTQRTEAAIADALKSSGTVGDRPRSVEALTNHLGPAHVGYFLYKVEATYDWLTDLVCTASNVVDPAQRLRIRAFLVALVEHGDPASVNELRKEFLRDVDFDYRFRKWSFTLRSMEPDHPALRTFVKKKYDELFIVRGEFRRNVARWSENVPAARSLAQHDALVADLRSQFRELIQGCGVRARQISAEVRDAVRDAGGEIWMRYANFEAFDMVLYPLAHDSGVDEGVPVEIVRISGRSDRLHGVRLGHFAAFLEEEWRRSDFAWGRVDAAESLLRRLDAPPEVTAEIREAILSESVDARNPRRADDGLWSSFVAGKLYDGRYSRARQIRNARRGLAILRRVLRDEIRAHHLPLLVRAPLSLVRLGLGAASLWLGVRGGLARVLRQDDRVSLKGADVRRRDRGSSS